MNFIRFRHVPLSILSSLIILIALTLILGIASTSVLAELVKPLTG